MSQQLHQERMRPNPLKNRKLLAVEQHLLDLRHQRDNTSTKNHVMQDLLARCNYLAIAAYYSVYVSYC